MFHNASSADSSPAGVSTSFPATASETIKSRHKRHQVVRACDECRSHRTKCDNSPICQKCKGRGTQCSNSDASKLGTLSNAQREIERLRKQVQELRQELQSELVKTGPHYQQQLFTPVTSPLETPYVRSQIHDVSGGAKTTPWEGIHISTARSQHKTWYGPSSLVYYINLVTTALSSSLNKSLLATTVLPSGASKLLHGPTSPAEGLDHQVMPAIEDTITSGVYLSATQEEYFIALFWQAFHTSLFPILDETEFTKHYQSLWTTSDTIRRPSALVDIVIAMCMQYGISMLPIAKQSVIVDNYDATIAGRWHYRRCQLLLASELETPTITTLRCHLLCGVYLCSGTFQNMSDSACGLAARTAYMLGLHLEPSQDMALAEREMRKRLWWALYALDSKIGMKLGRPFLLHDSLISPSLPSDKPEAAAVSGSNFAVLGNDVTWLSFNLKHTELFKITRAAYKAFFDRDLSLDHDQSIWDDPETMYILARSLSPHTRQLDEWVNTVPTVLKTKRQNGGTPFSTDATSLDIEQFSPLWLQRQRLILELLYHNLALNLFRPFIAFPTVRTSTPLISDEAIRCALHAIELTHIMHQVLSTTSILDGWHEAFQWQWNAAMTLIGFVFAYPQDQSTAAARTAIDLSITVFEIFGKSFLVATNTAIIIRDLSSKVDFLKEQNLVKQNELAQSAIPTEGFPATNDFNHGFDFDFTAFNAEQQNIYDMAVAIDLWGDPSTLWPNMGVGFP
jgi:hypothetical protein